MVLAISNAISTSFMRIGHGGEDVNIPAIIAKGNQQYDDYYEEDYPDQPYDYDDDYAPPPSKRKTYIPSQLNNLLETFRNHKQLGASLVGLGLIMTFVGLMLFFNGLLLRLGNICIIFGVPLLVGPDTVKQFFLQKSRTQASIITGIGIFLVMWGKPRFGILLEIFGLMSTMGNMNPLVLAMIKRLPLIGDMIAAFEGTGKKEPPPRGRGRSYRPQKRPQSEYF